MFNALYYALREAKCLQGGGGYMRGTLVWSSLALVVAFGFSIAANEKPTEAYSSTMKSNAATGQALRRDTMAKDYDAIAKDASTFKANFAKIEAFWTAKKA